MVKMHFEKYPKSDEIVRRIMQIGLNRYDLAQLPNVRVW